MPSWSEFDVLHYCRYTVICAQFPRPSYAGVRQEFPDCTRQRRLATHSHTNKHCWFVNEQKHQLAWWNQTYYSRLLYFTYYFMMRRHIEQTHTCGENLMKHGCLTASVKLEVVHNYRLYFRE